jgi:tetratricopeptide (TPR) repeat protein
MRAECRLALGEPETARSLLARARSLAPNNVAAIQLEARMSLDARDPDSAITLLQMLLNDDPHNESSRYQLALAFRLKGDLDRSLAELERLEESKELNSRLDLLYEKADANPFDATIHLKIADLWERLGKPDVAAISRRIAVAVQRKGALTTAP